MVSSSKLILTFHDFDSTNENWWEEKNNTQIQQKSWKFWLKNCVLRLMTKVVQKSFSVRKLWSVLHSWRNFSSLSHQSSAQKKVFHFFFELAFFLEHWTFHSKTTSKKGFMRSQRISEMNSTSLTTKRYFRFHQSFSHYKQQVWIHN